MIGRRIYLNEEGELLLSEGDYGRHQDGNWYCQPPGFHGSGNLTKHTVTEHEDGTITVSPSILITTVRRDNGHVKYQWHGYLERGVWRECQF